jgi:hypothetical protein
MSRAKSRYEMASRIGVLTLQSLIDLEHLKRVLVYFDEINIVHLNEGMGDRHMEDLYIYLTGTDWCSATVYEPDDVIDEILETQAYARGRLRRPIGVGEARDAAYVRKGADHLNEQSAGQAIAVPTYDLPTPFEFRPPERDDSQVTCCSLIFKRFPIPSELTPISDVIDFKMDPEAIRKRNALIAWQNKLVMSGLSLREIEEELDHCLMEYTSYMNLLDQRLAFGVVETVIKVPLALAETLATLRLSRVLEPIMDLIRLRLELRQAERNAPGREVAYITDARTRFSP